ncbi:L10-interacting MYB domain-containing protein-like protein [Tanacetum coccineum]
MAVNLTRGAILKMVTDKCTEKDLKPVLQVMYIFDGPILTKDDKQVYGVMLSDGSFWQFGHIPYEIVISNKLQECSIVQLTQFCTAVGETLTERGILVFNLNVIPSKCGLIGDPKLLPRIETSSDEDHVDSHLNEDTDEDSHHVQDPPTSKQKPPASTQKCCSHCPTQNKKRKRQLSNDNISVVAKDISKIARMMMEKEDKMMAVAKDVSKMMRMMNEKNKDDMGACFKKLENIGWGTEDPLYETALLLFGESADYRKLWLHLKPESCGKWVKNAGRCWKPGTDLHIVLKLCSDLILCISMISGSVL